MLWIRRDILCFDETKSSKMSKDRFAEKVQNIVEFITGGDMSCLMHLDRVLRRQMSSIHVKHLAENLN